MSRCAREEEEDDDDEEGAAAEPFAVLNLLEGLAAIIICW